MFLCPGCHAAYKGDETEASAASDAAAATAVSAEEAATARAVVASLKEEQALSRAVDPSLTPDDELAEAIRRSLLECQVLQGCPSTEADQHVNVPPDREDINVCPGADDDLAEAIRMSLLEGQVVPPGQEWPKHQKTSDQGRLPCFHQKHICFINAFRYI